MRRIPKILFRKCFQAMDLRDHVLTPLLQEVDHSGLNKNNFRVGRVSEGMSW